MGKYKCPEKNNRLLLEIVVFSNLGFIKFINPKLIAASSNWEEFTITFQRQHT